MTNEGSVSDMDEFDSWNKDETPEVAPTDKAPVTELPDRTPQITANRAFIARRKDALVQAFLAEERLTHETRKMSRVAWQAEFQRFLEAPRG